MRRKTIFGGVFTLAVLSACVAEDWPQWQGPDRTAISKETGLLKEWPKDGPPLAWKITGLGGGDSAPSVAGGRLFGMSHRGEDEIVWALSEKDGNELWATRLGPAYGQRMPQSKEGPGCSPTVDGDRVYVLGLAGDLACLKAADGEVVWRVSLTNEFGGRIPMWSYRESPLVDGDKLICTPGGEEATIVALNKLTGKTIWKCKVPEPSEPSESPGRGGRGRMGRSGAAYSSPIVINHGGQRQYVQFTACTVAGVAASDGKLLWRYDNPANANRINCTTPLFHDGHVFAASAYGAGGGLARLSRTAEDTFQAEEIWFSKKMQNHHGGVIYLDGNLYGANGGNEGGFLVCLDFKTGEVLWDGRNDPEKRAPKGSLALADGRLYYRTEKGPIVLVEPSPKEYIERGRFEQPERTRSPAWAHPVVANGKLYIRDQDLLLCYDVKAK